MVRRKAIGSWRPLLAGAPLALLLVSIAEANVASLVFANNPPLGVERVCLTTFRDAKRSAVQDAPPRVIQRGVRLDVSVPAERIDPALRHRTRLGAFFPNNNLRPRLFSAALGEWRCLGLEAGVQAVQVS